MKSLFTLLLSISILIGANSCMIFVGPHHDNGKHKGWYKNPNNPHHPSHNEGQNPPQKQKKKQGNNGNGKKKGK